MDVLTLVTIGLAVVLVVTVVVAVLYRRDLRRLEEQDKEIKSLHRQLDHLLNSQPSR